MAGRGVVFGAQRRRGAERSPQARALGHLRPSPSPRDAQPSLRLCARQTTIRPTKPLSKRRSPRAPARGSLNRGWGVCGGARRRVWRAEAQRRRALTSSAGVGTPQAVPLTTGRPALSAPLRETNDDSTYQAPLEETIVSSPPRSSTTTTNAPLRHRNRHPRRGGARLGARPPAVQTRTPPRQPNHSRPAPEVEPSARRESGSRWASTEITRLKLGLHERLDTNIPVCHGFRQKVHCLMPGQRSRFRSSYT